MQSKRGWVWGNIKHNQSVKGPVQAFLLHFLEYQCYSSIGKEEIRLIQV